MFETAKVDYNTLKSALGLGGLNNFQQGQQQALQLDQQQQALQEQEAQKQRSMQMQQELMDFSLKKKQDPRELVSLMTKYPEYSKQLTAPYESLKADEKQSMIKDGIELYSVLSKGTPEQKKAYLNLQYESAVNGGDDETIASAESIRDLYDHNPDATLASVQMNLGALVGFDKVGDIFKTPEDKANEARLIAEAKNQANPYYNAQQEADLLNKISTAKNASKTPEDKAREAGLIAQAQAPYKSNGLEITTNSDGTTTISQGGMANNDLEKPVKTEIQKNIIGLEKSASDLRVILANTKPMYNTYKNRIENEINIITDKLGLPIDKNKIGEYKRYQNSVKQFFNAYKKEITGASAALQEMKDLQDSLFSTDSSPSEFQAGLTQVQEMVNRNLRLQRKLLREGVAGNKLGKALDEAISSGQDDSPQERAWELKDKYKPEKIKNILLQEGYSI